MLRTSRHALQSQASGFTVIELLVVTAVVGLLMSLLLPSVQQMRESARCTACMNNIREVAFACHQFELTYRVLPPGHSGPSNASFDQMPEAQRTAQHRWTGHLGFLLPYLEQDAYYHSLDPDLWVRHAAGGPAWFLRANTLDLLKTTRLPVFQCPSDTQSPDLGSIYAIQDPVVIVSAASIGNGSTNYLGCSGNRIRNDQGHFGATGVFYSQSRVSLGDISDGLSNTILMGEVLGESAEDNPDDVQQRHAILCGAAGLDGFWRLDATEDQGPSYAVVFRSRHNSFVNMSFVDGSVKRIHSSVDDVVLKGLGSIAGGEALNPGF